MVVEILAVSLPSTTLPPKRGLWARRREAAAAQGSGGQPEGAEGEAAVSLDSGNGGLECFLKRIDPFVEHGSLGHNLGLHTFELARKLGPIGNDRCLGCTLRVLDLFELEVEMACKVIVHVGKRFCIAKLRHCDAT